MAQRIGAPELLSMVAETRGTNRSMPPRSLTCKSFIAVYRLRRGGTEWLHQLPASGGL